MRLKKVILILKIQGTLFSDKPMFGQNSCMFGSKFTFRTREEEAKKRKDTLNKQKMTIDMNK